MATATPTQLLAKLRAPFPLEAVKSRPGGGGKQLDYVAIETVLQRLLDVAPGFNWEAKMEALTSDGVVVSGQLTIGDKTAFGIGAMKNPDLDMAVKSANSEAMKNAAKNGFGVALELWDAEYREGLTRRRKMVGATEATLKQEVFRLATERLGRKPKSAKEAAGAFDAEPSALSSEEGLRAILEAEGVL